jgi:hypothetical protein
MSNVTVVFDPNATTDMHDFVGQLGRQNSAPETNRMCGQRRYYVGEVPEKSCARSIGGNKS